MKKLFLLLTLFISACAVQVGDFEDYPVGEPIDTLIIQDSLSEVVTNVLSYNWKYCAIHTTATVQNASVEAIKRYWKNELGWGNVPGYHLLIDRFGDIHVLRYFDFSGEITDDNVVYSIKGLNRYTLAIGYIGGIDSRGNPLDNRTDAQKKTLKMLVDMVQRINPDIIIGGHRDFQIYTNKACPSFDVREEYGIVETAEMAEDSLHIKLMDRVRLYYGGYEVVDSLLFDNYKTLDYEMVY